MNTNKNLDKFGLPPEDEFYQLSFFQVSDEVALEVRPYTYALMTWLKCRMNQPDIIDISPDSMKSMLTFISSTSGGDSELSSLEQDEGLNVDNVIEVQEESGLISHFIYVKEVIPEDITSKITVKVLNENPELQLGHFEVYTTKSTNENFLRFRSSIVLKDIRVGKVNGIQNLIDNSHLNFCLGINAMCAGDDDFKDWLINSYELL